MAAFVILFVLIAIVVLPITFGGWDATTIAIAVVGLLGVGVWAFFGIRAARRRSREQPEDDGPQG